MEVRSEPGMTRGIASLSSESLCVSSERGHRVLSDRDFGFENNHSTRSTEADSLTMYSKESTSSRKSSRSGRPFFFKSIRRSIGGKSKSNRSDDSVSGYSTTSTNFPDPDADNSQGHLSVRSTTASPEGFSSPTNYGSSGLMSPRSRRRANHSSISSQQEVIQQRQHQISIAQQQQEDRIVRLETLVEKQATRQEATWKEEVASLRATMHELAKGQLSLTHQLANERAVFNQLLASGLGCLATGLLVAIFHFNADSDTPKLHITERYTQLALAMVLFWVLLGILYTVISFVRVQASGEESSKGDKLDVNHSKHKLTSIYMPRQTDDSKLSKLSKSVTLHTPEENHAHEGVTHVGHNQLKLDDHHQSNLKTRRSMSVTTGDRVSSQPHSPSAASYKQQHGEDEDGPVCPEYGISHKIWLNHFGGQNIPLESCLHYKEMSPEQVLVFKEFRKDFLQKLGTFQGLDRRLPYPVPDDFSILRFLQADKYDKNLASERLLSTLVWRQQIKLHEIIMKPPAKLEAYRKLRVRRCMGWSKNGMPIIIERIGEFINSLGSDLAKSMTVRDWLDCYIYEMANIILEFRKGAAAGNVQWKMLFIADMKGVKFVHALRSISLLKAFSKEVEVHFPEQVGPIFLVNMPSVVHSAWKLCKQFLDPVVLAKIQLFPHPGTAAMLEHIDDEVLYKEYGGKNTDEFPHVKTDL